MIFETLAQTGHEEVIFCHNKDAGLKAIIAIHNSVLGPALGGLRMWPYATEQDALNDVLRLSRGMTYKAAVSGLNLGGGKGVIIGSCLPNGTTNQNLLPSPSRLSTPMWPPMSSVSCLQMASPNPVPPNFRVVELSACVND